MAEMKTIKIAITGPESTGKTALTNYLAETFNATAVAEVARKYLTPLDGAYDYNDVLNIAKLQMEEEDRLTEKSKLVFCDTELVVTKIWCDVKFGKCHDWILDELKRRKYDLVLLCRADLPWEYDAFRENPDDLDFLMGIYRKEVPIYYKNHVEIFGSGNKRFKMAELEVQKVLQKLKF